MDNDPLIEKLKSWFLKTGFPLEVETSSAFTSNSLHVEHSFVYPDPETGKNREIDVLGYYCDHTKLFRAYIAAECKADGKPWVVLTDPKYYHQFDPYEISVSSEKNQKLVEIHCGEYEAAHYQCFGPRTGGYALKQAFSEGEDRAFAACLSVLKASTTIAEIKDHISIVVPTIVVSAPIFEYSTSPNGEHSFQQVQGSTFQFSAYIDTFRSCTIRIISSAHLKTFAARFSAFAQECNRIFYEDISKARKRGT